MNQPATPALRARVAKRAGHRCEYCLLQEDDAVLPHEVDHILGLTSKGRVTVFLLQFNAPERVRQRLDLQHLGRYPYRA